MGRGARTDRPAVIIPARYASTRLPGKPLADLGGAPLIVRVYERARAIPGVEVVLVATDDRRIADAVEAAGGRVVMTRTDHPTGTDRIAEAAAGVDADIIVNVQGDLPCLDPAMVTSMVDLLRRDPSLPMATLMTPIRSRAECDDPNVVKVVTDGAGCALYFSRSPIPHGAGPASDAPGAPVATAATTATTMMRHLGLYAYRRAFLAAFTRLAPTPLERAERLEQLRALEHGHRIGVARWSGAAVVEVNTPGDLEEARALFGAAGAWGDGVRAEQRSGE
jgi:3-deoxy-manno-octulosonate cytidylyltransferase (CMP-KDO synthetase)